NKDGEWISLDFPTYGAERIEVPEKFIKASGINPAELLRTSNGWALAVCKTEKEVKEMSPDFAGLRDSGFGDLIVTAPSGSHDYDYVLRCFAPALGINEDPVTGSAQCVLVPYWNARNGKTEFNVRQLSARGGVLRCSLQDKRVIISGQAKSVFRAELFV
ncbi:MAG: PhzF family phenazine biosynthesis protein, partial [Bacteroidales bacterium]|nr:PhzF family phenazine biosynthesis protein [Bacteroidales bacterium]